MMSDRLFLLLKLRSDPDSFWMFKKIRKTCLNSQKNRPRSRGNDKHNNFKSQYEAQADNDQQRVAEVHRS